MTFFGLVSGLLTLLLLNQSVWLEMRINSALVLPLFTVTGFVSSFFYRKSVVPGVLLFLQGFVILLILLNYSFDFRAIAVMPAIWLREGFLIPFLNINQANGVLAAVMVIGNLAMLTRRKTSD